MEVEFIKMHGCGESTLLVDCFKRPVPPEALLGGLARAMLDPALGVGAESLLVIAPGADGRVSARSIDPVGEEGLVSFNALRCAARYASDSGASSRSDFPIRTSGGEVAARIIDSANVRLDMGAPVKKETAEELRERPLDVFTRAIEVAGRSLTYTPVSLGSSYGIVFVPAFGFALGRTARAIWHHPDFPEETGVAFAEVLNREEITLRVWERNMGGGLAAGARRKAPPGGRGSGSPPEGARGAESRSSCPAAACAVVAAVVNGFTDRQVFVHLAGGDVYLLWQESTNRLLLTGPAVYIFSGTYYFEEGEA